VLCRAHLGAGILLEKGWSPEAVVMAAGTGAVLGAVGAWRFFFFLPKASVPVIFMLSLSCV